MSLQFTSTSLSPVCCRLLCGTDLQCSPALTSAHLAVLLFAPILGSRAPGTSLQLSSVSSVLFKDVDLNHYRIGKMEGFEVLKKVKVRGGLSFHVRGLCDSPELTPPTGRRYIFTETPL